MAFSKRDKMGWLAKSAASGVRHGVGAQRVVFVLIFVVREDAVDAHADHFGVCHKCDNITTVNRGYARRTETSP